MKPRQIYSLTLRKVHAFMRARGFAAEQLLANTGLAAADLDDPYRLVHATQARQYYENVVALDPTGGLGLEIGWTTNLTDRGVFGLQQLASRTAHQAVMGSHSHRYVFNLLLEWDLEVVGDSLINTLSTDEPPGALRMFLLERGMGTLQAGAEDLIGPHARPTRVLLDYPAPAHVGKYEETFRCPLHFGQERCQLHYAADYLATALPTHDPRAHDLMDALQASLVRKLESRGDVVHDVIMALRRRPGVFPSLERVADGLGMSSRTLRRKLGQSDVTYQQLLDDERRRVAEEYLARSGASIQQVAALCGFQDAQNFSQAFKRWTGLAPSEYRKSRQ